MSEPAERRRLADQLRRAYEGESWSGPNLAGLLAGLTPEQALARPISGAHTIAELAAHVAVWLEVPARRLAGEAYEPATDAEDWPPVPDATAWGAARARLDAAYRALLAAVEALDDARLDAPTPGKPYSTYVLLHGAVQHVLYHAGQIALLRRAVGA